MTNVVRFDAPAADNHSLVGGKGANLGRLTKAGFPVPAGFTVSTAAYQAFLVENGLADRIAGIVGLIDFDDVDGVEKFTAEIRGLFEGAALPVGIAAEVAAEYDKLGDGVRVAVRSSGTAEDLDDASFAGQHDTYLHIRGLDGVLDAVKRCWASLWTARATSYRHHKGFDQDGVAIAVVVQTMVDAEVSGVMFTANPIKAITTEICINASWGLGEAIVSGLVTPDAYTVDLDTLEVTEKTLGTKSVRILLDDTTGQGTVHEEVPPSERDTFSLTDAQAAELAELGRGVMAHYDGLPQDTEWALAGGTFHLLQSRPITGANFAWDEAISDPRRPDDERDTFWSRTMSDDAWTGAVTPLFFSLRAAMFENAQRDIFRIYGFADCARMRYTTYYRGTVYWSTKIEKAVLTRLAPSGVRPYMLANTSPFDRDEILKAPFSYTQLLRVLARVEAMEPASGALRWVKTQQHYIDHRQEEAAGISDEELRRLSDEALLTYTDNQVAFEASWVRDIWAGYVLHWLLYGQMLAQVVIHWYDGDNPAAFIDLMTGTEQQTYTVKESLGLWKLTQQIRGSDELTALFRAHPGAEFFARLSDTETGRAFLADYQAFVAQYGHRGHADRDIYFTRRAEDPAVDYRLLAAMFSVDSDDFDPVKVEEAALQRKRAAYDDIVANLRSKPLGFMKVELFKLLNAYNQRLLVARDDERGYIDIITYSYKRAFLEINRRIMERGLLDDERDFYFLGRHELYDIFAGRANMALTRAKIVGRKRNFDLVNSKEVQNPLYLHHDQAVELPGEEDDGINLKGIPTSGGVVTATARVVKSLEEINRLAPGEIMICNSTDPGWTPVFLILAGAVFETGGAFAHCSCLSREYGLPAVQLAGALHRIPDGATITVNGNTGSVTILDEKTGSVETEPTEAETVSA